MNAWALTTLARVKQYIGGSFSASDDTTLSYLIDSVTDYVESYTQRRFKQTTYTNEEYDSDGSGIIVLRNYPVSSVTLKYRNSILNVADWNTIDSQDYFIDANAGIIQFAGNKGGASVSGNFNSWGTGFVGSGLKFYAVTYTAGYNFDNAATFLSNYAADLEYCVWRLIAAAFYNRGSTAGVQSERIGDYSVTYVKASFDDEEINSILEKYKSTQVRSYNSPLNY